MFTGRSTKLALAGSLALTAMVFSGTAAKANQACAHYANQAVIYAAKADAQGCGFAGPRWLLDYQAHYNFCLAQTGPALLLSEHTARISEYETCRANSASSNTDPYPDPNTDPNPDPGQDPGPDPNDNAQQSDSGEWIFPDSQFRRLSDSDVSSLSAAELWQARNEIYARKGYRFKGNRGKTLFGAMSWYEPRTRNVKLNSIEQANVALIQSYE